MARLSWQTRLITACFGAIPERRLAGAMTHPPRRRWPALVPAWLERRYDVRVEAIGAGRVAIASARTGTIGRQLFFLHGGAYTLGPLHWRLTRGFLDGGWSVWMVDYPLAPEHTVETTVPMVLQAWRAATAAGPVDLAGDSAGGGLALVLLQQIRDRGLIPPRRTALFSPWVDLVMDDPATLAAAEYDPVLSLRGLRRAARMYAGNRDLTDPLLSPANGDLNNLGEIRAWAATRELLLPQCRALAERAATAHGTRLDLHIGQGLIHDWPLFPSPEARTTLTEAARYLR